MSPGADEAEIRRLDAAGVREHLDALAAVLRDCVAGGASVGYLAPFPQEEARAVFEAYAADVEDGRRLLLAAFLDGELVGTVQVVLSVPPNQPHRAEIARMLVHRKARRRGIARRLMERAETEARAAGRTLLVLDAVTGGDAARLYDRLGWKTVGVIPGYALYPDGRPCDTTVFWKALDLAPLPGRVTAREERRERSENVSGRTAFTLDEARRVGAEIGIDWQTAPFDVEQFRMGMDVELEHGLHDRGTNVTGDDPVVTGKIALAHLNEFPDYYTRLARMEEEASRDRAR